LDFGPVTANVSTLNLINGQDNAGAAIHLAGTALTLDHIHVSNSQATFGGAIWEQSGTLTVTASAFISNSATIAGVLEQTGGSAVLASSSFTGNVASLGGAIRILGNTRLDVRDSLFDGNRSDTLGGAIDVHSPSTQVSVDRSTFTHNQTLTTTALTGGGAIVNSGLLTLTRSTLADNLSLNMGAGLFVLYGQATVRDSTFSGNQAQGSGGAISAYSDSAAFPSQLSLNNVTLSDNTADLDQDSQGDGGGLAVSSFVTVTIANSILAGNFDTPNNLGGGAIQPDCSGALAGLHFSLVGRGEGCTVVLGQDGGSHIGNGANPLDALLGPLADNGGPTQTRALLAGSPALDAGSPAAPGSGGLACEAADQRGVLRPLGLVCDMGAFEVGMRVYLPLIRR
jgi:predicted outer membrane repeat protein